jgi:hypothetical protein
MLICLILAQWLAGGLYLRKTVVVEFHSEMSSMERMISSEIFERYGFQPDVALVDDEAVGLIHLMGYAAPFIHEVNVRGEDQAFTFEEFGTTHYRHVELGLNSQPSNPAEKERRVACERLFHQYCIGETSTLTNNQEQFPEKNFAHIGLRDMFDHTVQSPPPRLA